MSDSIVDPGLSADGWKDASDALSTGRAWREASLHCGDTVLYQTEGETRKPAVLIDREGLGWLARGTRPRQQRIYLAPQSIVQLLPRNELADEAA